MAVNLHTEQYTCSYVEEEVVVISFFWVGGGGQKSGAYMKTQTKPSTLKSSVVCSTRLICLVGLLCL